MTLLLKSQLCKFRLNKKKILTLTQAQRVLLNPFLTGKLVTTYSKLLKPLAVSKLLEASQNQESVYLFVYKKFCFEKWPELYVISRSYHESAIKYVCQSGFWCATEVSCTIQIWTVSGILSPEPCVQQILSGGFLIKSPHGAQVLLFGLFWFCFYCLSTKELQNKRQNVKVSPGKLRQRAACFPAGRPCLMSHIPSHSPAVGILSNS